MRLFIITLLVFILSGCTAMLVGGSGSNTATDCEKSETEGQGREC